MNAFRKVTVSVATVVAVSALVVPAIAGEDMTPPARGCDVTRYRLVEGSFNWFEAQLAARALNGHLATIGSAAEQACIERALAGRAPRDRISGGYGRLECCKEPIAWIGATDRGSEGNWRWVRGTQTRGYLFYTQARGVRTYANWFDNEPNDFGEDGEDCGLMLLSSGRWNDGQCSGGAPFVLERN